MKIIAIILSGVVYLFVFLPLISIVWVYPFSSTTFTIIHMAALINYIFAGIIAADKAEKFYKWFISKLK